MAQSLNFLAWVACIIYSTIPCFWFLVHPQAEYWRSRKRSPYLILLPAWLVMWILVAAATARWRHVALYSAQWPWIPAILLFATGFWLYSQSRKNFSAKQLGGLPELVSGHPEQRLVTAGIRAHLRHPVYLGHLCEMLAWSTVAGLVVCYGLTLFAMITGAFMIRMEDKELEQRFGNEYRTYRAKVPAIIFSPTHRSFPKVLFNQRASKKIFIALTGRKK
jgi:protein-S-isoprenylcysteine O-methyltransferase Ste14